MPAPSSHKAQELGVKILSEDDLLKLVKTA